MSLGVPDVTDPALAAGETVDPTEATEQLLRALNRRAQLPRGRTKTPAALA
jgi:hypothetical protein